MKSSERLTEKERELWVVKNTTSRGVLQLGDLAERKIHTCVMCQTGGPSGAALCFRSSLVDPVEYVQVDLGL